MYYNNNLLTGLFVTGIAVLILPYGGVQGLVFLIAGLICFIPGAYVSILKTNHQFNKMANNVSLIQHIIYIYLAVKGRKGYDFYHLPLFN